MTDEEKWKAVGRNDASYDGRFVYAVGSTGIFGRPSCASKLPLSKHVRFFSSTAQVVKAGFRPCKRCRSDRPVYRPAAELAQSAKAVLAHSPMTHYAFYPFAFGLLKVGYTDQAIVCLDRIDQADAPNERSSLSEAAYQQIREYLDGRRQAFDLPCIAQGTQFQQSVWSALRRIPYGETRTYKQIAEAAGNPKACRAVGMANHRNPLIIVVPCHRVIGSSGSLVGYGGGLDMKRALLELEARHVWRC
ncbi:MAG: methylated-DNA--[protein]-cysteine S-methyltransferase [Sporolactobacillus sp.]